ncbi:NAD(P)/FAD-dependent oxidoreductase [Methylomagnum ishizawai]|uniref:NAD(P)/FAD-dependent oxidoreductase n=1 Tax=Methylomagnum ishizawai TaxID=1760988 RepID=UPI001C340E04|nr:FAD-dependent oxidoreductase [Methylomagnum ishizawai]BBL77367.1 hypothetical protein MishRS11D_44650 [Methylomagnum ishizawai]
MKIVVGFGLSPRLQTLLLGDNVNYRPDLEFKGEYAVEAMLEVVAPEVFISRSPPGAQALRLWREALGDGRPPLLICVAEPEGPPVSGAAVQWISPAAPDPEIEAFKAAERFSRPAPPPAARPRPAQRAQRVLLVGAGAVNLVTAVQLVGAGFQAELVDAGDDPRSPYDWRRQGCTFGSEDARVFSLNESRQHHFKGMDVPEGGPRHYRAPIADDGWLYKRGLVLTDEDQRWIREAERVPPWLLREFNQEIIAFNRESEPLWRRLAADHPGLFEEAGYRRGLLRLYADPEKYERACVVEEALGAVREKLSPRELAARYPVFAESVDNGYILGALEVIGFSVNLHRFCRNLIDWLAARGAAFRWNTPVQDVAQNADGEVQGIAYGGGLLEADHFVVSPGAFPGGLLRGLDSHNQIKPMVGMWLTLPDVGPQLDLPLKVTRRGFAATSSAEGANVIPGVDRLGRRVVHVSSGHGLVGSGEDKAHLTGLEDMARAVEETAQGLFPTKYRQALAARDFPGAHRYCIRPWTASGLGLFETRPSRKGLFIVTGGHNTGGFAQAPAVARAVEDALAGRHHPMHVLYHPLRLANFTGVHLGRAR